MLACEALLADRLRVLGPDHPDILEARSNVVRWRGTAGDPAGAYAATEEMLADRLRVLGPDQPRTLAQWLARSGDRASAVARFEAGLLDQLRVLGPDHPRTMATRHDLERWREVALG